MVSLCMSAQNVSELISEKTKDVAYSAPNTTFLNKKLYAFNSNFGLINTSFFFKANKTGELIKKIDEYSDCSYEQIIPFTWSRNNNKLTISFNFKKMTTRNIVYTDPSASERTKAEIREAIRSDIDDQIKKTRVMDSYICNYYINRLDAKYLLLEGLSLKVSGLGQTKTESCDDMYFCSTVGKKDVETLKAKLAKAEEEKKAAEEAEKEND